jgi:hypothetical protein
MTAKKPASGLRYFYAMHLRGRLLPLAILLGLASLLALYLLGVLPEPVAGMILAGLIVLGLSGYAAVQLLGTRAHSALALGLPVATALVAMAPVVSTLHPGQPLARGPVSAAGQSLALSHLPHHIRVLLHADFGLVSASSVDVVLGVGGSHLEGHLDRTVTWGRVARRTRGKMTREHSSQVVSATVAERAPALTVEDLRGNAPGGLQFEVFRDWVPFGWESALAGLLLLVSATLAGRLGAGAGTAAALAVPLVFGLAIYRMATPDAAVGAQLGALLVAGIGGTVAGGTLGWIAGRLRRAD